MAQLTEIVGWEGNGEGCGGGAVEVVAEA